VAQQPDVIYGGSFVSLNLFQKQLEMLLDIFGRDCTIMLYIVLIHIPVLFPRYVEKGWIVFDRHLSDDFPVF